MSRDDPREERRLGDRRADDPRADSRRKQDRRELDRRHTDVLRTATFLEKIPQATWLEAMVELEIAAPEATPSTVPTQMSFAFDDLSATDQELRETAGPNNR